MNLLKNILRNLFKLEFSIKRCLILFFTFVFIYSCSFLKYKFSNNKTDIEFEKFLKEFQILGHLPNTYKPTYSFDKLDKKILGSCYYYINHVKINKPWWINASEEEKRIVVYHELGHCLLFLGHTESLLNDGCPYSIMHPYILSTHCFNLHYNHYISDLFGI